MATLQIDQQSISNILIAVTVARLEQKLRLEIDDQSRAGLVRIGRLQDDPSIKKINVLVHPGGEEWPDVINTNNTPGHGMFAPTFEFGGMNGFRAITWRRRLKIQIQFFYPNESSLSNTLSKTNVVISRAMNALFTQDFKDFDSDSFGEYAYDVAPIKSHIIQGGGQPDYNWRGEIVIEYMTTHEPKEL